MRRRTTVTIIDLELRVMVAYRAADGAYGEVPPTSVFDSLLDERLKLMVPGAGEANQANHDAGAAAMDPNERPSRPPV